MPLSETGAASFCPKFCLCWGKSLTQEERDQANIGCSPTLGISQHLVWEPGKRLHHCCSTDALTPLVRRPPAPLKRGELSSTLRRATS